MSELPLGWEWTTIGEVAATSLGKMLDKKQSTGMHPTPYLRNINVRWGAFDLSDLAQMDIRPDELDRVLAQPGDVIACEGGEPGRAAVWRGPDTIALQKALHRIQPTEAIVPGYIALLLQHLALSRQLEPFFTGTTIKHLPQEKLRMVSVPLPPLAEQRRIVAAIEQHLSRLDAAEAALSDLSARLARFEDLVYRQVLGHPAPRRRLGDVARTASGGTPKRSRSEFFGGPIPWIKSGELGDGIVTRTEETITEVALEESSAKLVPEGTVLIAMYGATIGKLGRVGVSMATTNQAVAAMYPCEKLTSDFLWNALRALRPDLVRLGKGGAQPNISQSILRELEIPVPSLSEQVAANAGIERSISVWRETCRAVAAAQRRASGLRRSVLAAAFSGRLVLQDPGEEPASALLERIRAARVADTSTMRKNQKRRS